MSVYGTTLAYEQEEMRMLRDRSGDTVEPAQASAIYTEAMNLPDQVGFILDRKYGIPHLKGIPLFLRYVNFQRIHIEYLTTLSCNKTTVNLTPPKGYKLVKTIEKAIGGGASDQVLNEYSKIYHWSDDEDSILGPAPKGKKSTQH